MAVFGAPPDCRGACVVIDSQGGNNLEKPKAHMPNDLLPGLRAFIKARAQWLVVYPRADNAGAIHSVERIVDLLGRRLRYPKVGGLAGVKAGKGGKCPWVAFDVEMSQAAHKTWHKDQGGKQPDLRIEHVNPKRAFTEAVIGEVAKGATDEAVLRYIREHYRLVILTKDQMSALNKLNRSMMTLDRDRIEEAGIEIYCPNK